MPRPTVAVSFPRPSRSSAKAELAKTEPSSSSAKNVASLEQTASSIHANGSEPSSSSAESKRLRKPSQRMIEALQTVAQDVPEPSSSEASSGKSKRTASPAFASPPSAKKRKGEKGQNSGVKGEQQAPQEEADAEKSIPTLKISLKKTEAESDRVVRSSRKMKAVEEVQPPEMSAPQSEGKQSKSSRAKKNVGLSKEPNSGVSEVAFSDNDKSQTPDAALNDLFDLSGGQSAERRLTARQRAKLYGAEDHLIKLEDPKRKTPPPDHQEKREERNKKRREIAAKRREDLKKETVEKLLTKTTGTRKGAKSETVVVRRAVRYRISADGMRISFPDGVETIPAMAPIQPPALVRCGVQGCNQMKKYSCSKTGIPLCSLQCYKKNLAA